MSHDPEILSGLRRIDLDRIAEIELAGFDKSHDLAANLPELLEAPTADLLVSRNAESLIASMMIVNVTYGSGGLGGRIDDVATHPDSRRDGHAKALLNFALQWFDERGVSLVLLESEDDRQPAHRLYESRGFEIYDTNQFQLGLS